MYQGYTSRDLTNQAVQHVFRPQPPVQANQPSKAQPGVKKQPQSLVKKPTAKTDASKARTTLSPGSSAESSEDSDLEIQADEPSPVPATRPSEPVAAAEYDTLQAVWFPRNRKVHSDKVKTALVAFKDLAKAIRDVWKERTQAMNAAENKGESDKATRIKTDVVLQRRLINAVISTTLEKGHPKIVEKYVLFHSHSLTVLADPCHGHRSLKRIESLTSNRCGHSQVSLIMALSKGKLNSAMLKQAPMNGPASLIGWDPTGSP